MKDMITVFSASKFYPVTGSRTCFLLSDVWLDAKISVKFREIDASDVFEEKYDPI